MIVLDEPAQHLALAEQMPLPDDLFQCLRPQPRRQRRGGVLRKKRLLFHRATSHGDRLHTQYSTRTAGLQYATWRRADVTVKIIVMRGENRGKRENVSNIRFGYNGKIYLFFRVR